MKVVQIGLLVLHLLGVLALLVGLLVQVRRADKRVIGPVRDGIGLTFLAGLLLVGVLEGRNQDFDHAKVAVMFAIGLVILVLVMANLKADRIADWLYWSLLALVVVNIGVAYAG
jgi:peptidoglycan/LPS O-acetylase OafA/YrhL